MSAVPDAETDTDASAGSWPLSRAGRAVLSHPDQDSAWVILAAAEVPDVPSADLLTARLAALTASLPVVGARLADGRWRPGAPTAPTESADPLGDGRLTARFNLAAEPPVRVLAGPGLVAVAAHHAALDGLSLIAVLAALLGAPPLHPGTDPTATPSQGPLPLLRRLARPADTVAPSAGSHHGEILLTANLTISGPDTTARLAHACLAAAAEHNRRLARPWRRIGLSIGVGGPPGAGNVATYRRLDLRPGDPVIPAVRAALANPTRPPDTTATKPPPTIVSKLAARASDSILVSNVGRLTVPTATRLIFAPVARGRSAVAFGAAGLASKDTKLPSTLTLRTQHLSHPDAHRLLTTTVHHLQSHP